MSAPTQTPHEDLGPFARMREMELTLHEVFSSCHSHEIGRLVARMRAPGRKALCCSSCTKQRMSWLVLSLGCMKSQGVPPRPQVESTGCLEQIAQG